MTDQPFSLLFLDIDGVLKPRCPNCDSLMTAGEGCPECDHDDRGPCTCDHCLMAEDDPEDQEERDDA